MSTWNVGKSYHMDWIRSYYAQGLRGREHEVLVAGRSEDDREITLRCCSEENDRITGYNVWGQRIEVAWCTVGRRDILLQRFSSDRIYAP